MKDTDEHSVEETGREDEAAIKKSHFPMCAVHRDTALEILLKIFSDNSIFITLLRQMILNLNYIAG